MDGQISIFDIMEQGTDKRCPYNPNKSCENAENCKEFMELYGYGEHMAEKVKYKAVNIDTGEEHIGNVDELSALLFASTGAIYRTVSTGTRLGGVWKIEKVTFKKSSDKPKNVPYKLLLEWDAVTKSFKAASARARCRQNGATN